jgi:CTP-dependent riboflavin kinase
MQQKNLLEKAEKFEVTPEKGYCNGTLMRAQMDGLDCGIIFPQVPGYPIDVLEVVAAMNLRERLELSDGCEACVWVII